MTIAERAKAYQADAERYNSRASEYDLASVYAKGATDQFYIDQRDMQERLKESKDMIRIERSMQQHLDTEKACSFLENVFGELGYQDDMKVNELRKEMLAQ